MNNQLQKLERHYTATLRQFLENEQEAVLEQAYELGRTAIAKGLGVLEMTRVHQKSLGILFQSFPATKSGGRYLKAADAFLWESLSPFEATHRGFLETNSKLQQRNQELEAEIGQRKKVEVALRQSEKHYRRLFNEAQTMQENLRNLSNKILRTQEEERKRISRELHDEVGQSLTAISVRLATSHNDGPTSATGGSKKLADTQRLLQETMETVHRFARDLRPAVLDELGLLPALRSYLNGFADRSGLRVHFHGNPIAEKLQDDQKTVLFRIAQESLTNVSKHAHASRVEVAVCKLKDGVCMEVADDGRSFKSDPITTAKNKRRLGLLGMHERVRLVNGRFTVTARPGKGTTIRVEIPFHSTRAIKLSPGVVDHFEGKSPLVHPPTQYSPQTI
jgi:two-component system, NarL family, sensor histidine kinase DegS